MTKIKKDYRTIHPTAPGCGFSCHSSYKDDLIKTIEQRLKTYERFLENPPRGSSFSEASYERKTYQIALKRSLQDCRLLLLLVQEQCLPIPLTRKKRGQ